MRTASLPVAAVAFLLTIGCAANPKPGEPGYPYNVAGSYESAFTVEGTRYEGITDLETHAGGAVQGDFSIVRPVAIVGDIRGTVAGDSLSWTADYTQSEGCEGTVTASGSVSEGGGRVEGPMKVDDSCGGVLEGSFVLVRGTD